MLVKICGITNADDARAAADCGADFIGLILAPSPRRVALTTASAIANLLPAGVEPVLLFRDAALDEVRQAVAATGVHCVQLHGRERITYVGELIASRPELHIIKAWEVTSPASGQELAEYRRASEHANANIDVLILDAPKGGPHPGYECLGELSRACRPRPPQVWCAGGLTPENLTAAVSAGSYDGVDVASGIETCPGTKDHAAMRRFIETAKRL